MGMSDILLGVNPAMMKEYPIPGGVAILFGASCYREYRVTFVLCGPYASCIDCEQSLMFLCKVTPCFCLLQESTVRPFSSRRIKSLIVTSLFAIALSEIRTGRI